MRINPVSFGRVTVDEASTKLNKQVHTILEEPLKDPLPNLQDKALDKLGFDLFFKEEAGPQATNPVSMIKYFLSLGAKPVSSHEAPAGTDQERKDVVKRAFSVATSKALEHIADMPEVVKIVHPNQ